MMTTLHERVSTLEASVYRTEQQQVATRAAAEQVTETVEAVAVHVAHLRGGVDTVSGDLRALAHELHTEVVPRLDGIDARLDGIDGRLDGIDGRLEGIDGRLDGIDGQLGAVQRGVSALLAHFAIADPNTTTGTGG